MSSTDPVDAEQETLGHLPDQEATDDIPEEPLQEGQCPEEEEHPKGDWRWTCPEGSVFIEATVVTGLETMAREEIREKLGLQAAISRGRVWFAIQESRIEEVSVI